VLLGDETAGHDVEVGFLECGAELEDLRVPVVHAEFTQLLEPVHQVEQVGERVAVEVGQVQALDVLQLDGLVLLDRVHAPPEQLGHQGPVFTQVLGVLRQLALDCVVDVGQPFSQHQAGDDLEEQVAQVSSLGFVPLVHARVEGVGVQAVCPTRILEQGLEHLDQEWVHSLPRVRILRVELHDEVPEEVVVDVFGVALEVVDVAVQVKEARAESVHQLVFVLDLQTRVHFGDLAPETDVVEVARRSVCFDCLNLLDELAVDLVGHPLVEDVYVVQLQTPPARAPHLEEEGWQHQVGV